MKCVPWVLSGDLLGSVLVIIPHEDMSNAFNKGLKIGKTGNTYLIRFVPVIAEGKICLMVVPITFIVIVVTEANIPEQSTFMIMRCCQLSS